MADLFSDSQSSFKSKLQSGVQRLRSTATSSLGRRGAIHQVCLTCDGPMRDIIKQTKLEASLSATVFSITEPEKLAEHIKGLAKDSK